ncbi:MAG: hypothetical protein JWN98_897 [Abditibacteriota bacterium]|nr:hypothetical protein [Abditibacteriota bacterium]
MAQDETNQTSEFVTGDNIEPDESRTPVEFADEEWLSLDGVAKYFGVPATRVREWIAGGLLSTEPGGSIERIARSEIERIGNPDDVASREFESEHS